MPAGAESGDRWTCPKCARQFGRHKQSHQCEPSLTLDEYFAGRPPSLRQALDAIVAQLSMLGPVTVDPVHVGVLLKRGSTFAELRPKRGHMSLGMGFPREVHHARITRTTRSKQSRRVWQAIDIRGPEDIHAEVRGLLDSAYFSSR